MSDPSQDTPVESNPSSGGEPADPQEEAQDQAGGAGVVTTAATPSGPPIVETVGEGDSSDDDSSDDDDDSSDEEVEDDNDHDEDDPDMMDVLPPPVALRVEALRTLHAQRDEIMKTYTKERAELERKFSALCTPIYEKRKEIVAGKHDEFIKKAGKKNGEGEGEEKKKDEEKEKEEEGEKGEGDEAPKPAFDLGAAAAEDDDDADDGENVKGIPQFWVCAMGHMDVVAELIAERDVDCLEHLTNISCEDYENGEGFVLRFTFEPNDYFTNEVLTKRYEIPNLLLEDEPILKDVVGCDIDWKPERSLTFREVKKKQRAKQGRKAGQIRTVTKRERTDSFFHFFSPPKLPSMDEMDEEQADRIEHAFDVDYDVAQAFRGHIVPKAVVWFTGEAMDEGMDALLDEEGMPVEGEDADGAGGASPFPAPAAGGGENPECQQS
uniref:Nucleosome assembly protein n=1 Tax=Odontella aurita TaxID=265563 RepID=A0A7S4J1F5_9STRA